MPITLNGNTGITSTGGYVGDGLSIADDTTGLLSMDLNGNLGLGVSPSAWGGNYRAIDIQFGAIANTNASNVDVAVTQNAFFNGTNWITKYTGASKRYIMSDAGHLWFNGASAATGGTISFTQAMTLDSSGNLGLGVTPSAWRASQKAIEIGGTFSGISGGLNTLLYSNVYTDSSNVDRYKANGAALLYGQLSAGNHVWSIAPSGTAGNAISWTQAMTLTAGGNLLVGTTSDGFRVSITGTSSAVGTASNYVFVTDGRNGGSTTDGGRIYFGRGGATTLSGAAGFIGSFTALSGAGGLEGGLIFGTNASSSGLEPIERARINSSGQMFTMNGLGVVSAAYDARAWVNFIGTGTVGIRGSGNVSSITDNGVGDYTITFTTAMSDNGYAVLAGQNSVNNAISSAYPISVTTSAVRINCQVGGGFNDPSVVSVVVFR